jgi:hypothetical protein
MAGETARTVPSTEVLMCCRGTACKLEAFWLGAMPPAVDGRGGICCGYLLVDGMETWPESLDVVERLDSLRRDDCDNDDCDLLDR